MVLRLKTRESRSLPGLQNATQSSRKQSKARNQYGTPAKPPFLLPVPHEHETNCKGNVLARRDEPRRVHRTSFCQRQKPRYFAPRQKPDGAGWSSPVARQAHNLKAAGSNPAPATKNNQHNTDRSPSAGLLAFLGRDPAAACPSSPKQSDACHSAKTKRHSGPARCGRALRPIRRTVSSGRGAFRSRRRAPVRELRVRHGDRCGLWAARSWKRRFECRWQGHIRTPQEEAGRRLCTDRIFLRHEAEPRRQALSLMTQRPVTPRTPNPGIVISPLTVVRQI